MYDSGTTLPQMITMLQVLSDRKNKRELELPPEEREQLKQKRYQQLQEKEKQKQRVWSVQQGRCPDCNNKLRRGKKDKDNKRRWTCEKCKRYFYL